MTYISFIGYPGDNNGTLLKNDAMIRWIRENTTEPHFKWSPYRLLHRHYIVGVDLADEDAVTFKLIFGL